MKKYIFIFVLCAASLLILIIHQNGRFNNGLLRVVFCDIGQGDGIYIRTPKGADILIDGGPDSSILNCLARHTPFWDREIDIMVMTHPDADHLNGLVHVAKRYKVKNFVTSKTKAKKEMYDLLSQTLKTQGVNPRFTCSGDQIKLNEVRITTMWPAKCPNNEFADSVVKINDASVIQTFSYKNFKLLLTGDAEQEVISKFDELIGDINVLKVPHHGSNGGMNNEILKNIRPELAVISVGAKNRYGHPTKETLATLVESDTKILRTDQSGDVVVISDGLKYWVE